jgi:hypothetical protein
MLAPGLVVSDRFEVEELAGRGGMGMVYRALDRLTGEPVALKIMHEASDVMRFRREAWLMVELRHPRIARHIAHGETAGGEHFLAMEWLVGETLAQRLRAGRLSISASVAIARAAAEALAAAHEQGIVHRDVKPSNVFLVRGRSGGDDVKLLDFGVATLQQTTLAPRYTRGTVGTPGYMAPEQARGDEEVDPRADVFSLGLVLYECLSGRPAFRAAHPLALFGKVILEQPPTLAELRPETPAELQGLVTRLIAKHRDQRPPDGAAVAQALAAVGERLAREPERAPEVVTRPRPRHLTAEEHQLHAAVLADLGRPARASSDAGPTPSSSEHAERVAALIPRHAEVAWLADGVLLVAVRAAGVASDAAARAASIALSLRRHFTDAVITLAMGRAQSGASSQSPSGEAIDRAVALMPTTDSVGPGRKSPVGVLIDDLTAALLDARFEQRATPGGHLLLEERDSWGDPRTVLGKHLPCVGRDRELSLLAGLFDEGADESLARIALVTGVAGIGKTRLATELVRALRQRGRSFELWRARGEPRSAASSLALIEACLRRGAGVVDGESAAERRAKLRARVASAGVAPAEEARVLDALCHLAGGHDAGPDDGPRPGEAALRQAFADLLAAECARAPVVLLIEDLHWADAFSVGFLDAVLARLRHFPLFVLALARPEVHHTFPALWAERDLNEIKVNPLRPRAAASLVNAALDDPPSELRARIVDQAAGHPFLLEELLRAAGDGLGAACPENVLAVVQARLGKLPAPARSVLRAASVFGERFWSGAVETLVGADETGAPLDHWLDVLRERELVVGRDASRFPREEELAFSHALVRDAAYSLLTDVDRALGHRLAGEWLERAGEWDAAVLAGHFHLGGDGPRAARLFLAAAEQAYEHHDFVATAHAVRQGVGAGALGPTLASLRAIEGILAARREESHAPPPPSTPGTPPPSSYRFEVFAGTRIFYEVCVGRWSRAFTEKYIARFKEEVAPLLGAPWAKLCDLGGWLSTHPDAVELIMGFLTWSIDAGMAHVAYVIPDAAARLQTRRIIEDTPLLAARSELFPSAQAGLAWLAARGYPTSPGDDEPGDDRPGDDEPGDDPP